MSKFWIGTICFVGGLTLGFIGAAYWAYWAAGSVVLIGGAIQAAMRHKAKKAINFNSNGDRPKPNTKHTFRPGGH